MEVYIESAILENFVIDGIVLLVALIALRLPVKYYKVIISSLVGTAYAVVSPLFIIPTWLSMILKVFVSILMCLIATPKNTIRQFVLYYVVFLTATFVMGGFCFFVIYMCGGDSSKLPIPLSLIILLTFVYVIVLIKCIKAFYSKKKLHSNIFDIEIMYNNRKVKTRGYLDTGNTLTEGTLPVVVVSPKVFNRLSPTPLSNILLYHDFSSLKDAHYKQYSTIQGRNKILVFRPDNFCIKDKARTYIDVWIGVSLKPLSHEFDVLIGDIIKEGV